MRRILKYYVFLSTPTVHENLSTTYNFEHCSASGVIHIFCIAVLLGYECILLISYCHDVQYFTIQGILLVLIQLTQSIMVIIIVNIILRNIEVMNASLRVLKQLHSKCGIFGNWRRIAHLDTTQGDSCPSYLRTVTNTTTGQTACGRTTGPGCSKLTFIIGDDYSNVCGRVRGYQHNTMDAFDVSTTKSAPARLSIAGYYVDGVSIAQGQLLRHLWTYAVCVSEQYHNNNYQCPCAVPTNMQ